MMRKILVGIIILLLLIPSVVSISINNTTQSKNGNILYVGGIGPGNYTRIQNAIDNASDGDTVFVYNESSPYYENIIIDKSISLIGENKNNNIIDGSNKKIAVKVIADYVNISGFTIQYGYLFGIEINSMYNTIMNNIFTEQAYGIKLHKSSYNSIISNIISNNGEGIWIWHSNINMIRDNDFSNNGWGVDLIDSQNNDIFYNNISDNKYGIALFSSNYNIIKGNTISLNREDGIMLRSDRNNISCNNISKNKNGISIGKANNNSITNNNIKNNDNGIFMESTIYIYGNIVFHNNFINNGWNARVHNSDIIWDDGEFGNYWSDYREKYPFARKILEKGIWDTPYEVPYGFHKDNCPLIKPWPEIKSRDLPENTAPVISNGKGSPNKDYTQNSITFQDKRTIPDQPVLFLWAIFSLHFRLAQA